jgi:hypothetical protein
MPFTPVILRSYRGIRRGQLWVMRPAPTGDAAVGHAAAPAGAAGGLKVRWPLAVKLDIGMAGTLAKRVSASSEVLRISIEWAAAAGRTGPVTWAPTAYYALGRPRRGPGAFARNTSIYAKGNAGPVF